MTRHRILILGGTGEARQLAAELLADGFDVISSLAGVTENQVVPVGRLRRGGFGGVEGLVRYLREEGVAAIADATHPFAVQMSSAVHEAAGLAGVPLVRLERPAWQAGPGDNWTIVQSAAEAAAALPAGARALVTIGRKEVSWFLARSDITGLARMIEAFPGEAGLSWRFILQRPPYDIAGEIELIRDNNITHLVTKNSGGNDTVAKIAAARQLGLPVVVIARPRKPETCIVQTIHDAVHSLRGKLLP